MKKKSNRKSSAPSPIIKTKPLTSSPSSLNKISDLKKTTSLHIDSIKRNIDCCYSDLLKDMDVSHIRLQKRFQAQNQACEQSMVEAEMDFKKMIDLISETRDTMEASYMDVIAEAQAQATRLRKTTIPELKQSVEKAIDTIRTHYGAAST
ncbi:hypothetical protein CTI12_AA285890 [Artemisia annua]|uniref:Uncharacterized protein n=1 Tax=Artemisia annua TaxID=35608 RepID=A0A2U1NBG7_ARTAN|nr:hypothetical protein CTI12_AA285890 [Artemisia annua]